MSLVFWKVVPVVCLAVGWGQWASAAPYDVLDQEAHALEQRAVAIHRLVLTRFANTPTQPQLLAQARQVEELAIDIHELAAASQAVAAAQPLLLNADNLIHQMGQLAQQTPVCNGPGTWQQSGLVIQTGPTPRDMEILQQDLLAADAMVERMSAQVAIIQQSIPTVAPLPSATGVINGYTTIPQYGTSPYGTQYGTTPNYGVTTSPVLPGTTYGPTTGPILPGTTTTTIIESPVVVPQPVVTTPVVTTPVYVPRPVPVVYAPPIVRPLPPPPHFPGPRPFGPPGFGPPGFGPGRYGPPGPGAVVQANIPLGKHSGLSLGFALPR